jgi:PleD family two-component response regulator
LSLGIAEFAKNGDTAEAVLAAADAALYQAKRAGRDRVTRAK